MCLMKSPKNFEKIAILKIWQLVSFWGVKTHFGEIHPWKDAFSGVKFFIFTSIAYLIVMVLTRCILWYIYLNFLGPWNIPETTFVSMNQYFNDKSSIFLTEVNFYISEENQLSYFQNGYFFKILCWFQEAHNWLKCWWKKQISFETFH